MSSQSGKTSLETELRPVRAGAGKDAGRIHPVGGTACEGAEASASPWRHSREAVGTGVGAQEREWQESTSQRQAFPFLIFLQFF